ncbi:MAG TPA: hypothetical protein VGG03_14570 [Thermoanaerobaculia bacterium]|jgi:hypothetical protein
MRNMLSALVLVLGFAALASANDVDPNINCIPQAGLIVDCLDGQNQPKPGCPSIQFVLYGRGCPDRTTNQGCRICMETQIARACKQLRTRYPDASQYHFKPRKVTAGFRTSPNDPFVYFDIASQLCYLYRNQPETCGPEPLP